MLASRVLITAGTPGHMYLDDRQAKCLGRRSTASAAGPRAPPWSLEDVLHSRHGLVDGLDTVAHGELIHDLLRHVVKVDLPGVVSASFGDLDGALTEDIGGVVEQVLHRKVKTLTGR